MLELQMSQHGCQLSAHKYTYTQTFVLHEQSPVKEVHVQNITEVISFFVFLVVDDLIQS